MINKSYMVACCGLVTLLGAGQASAMNYERWVNVEGGYSFSIAPNNTNTEPMPGVNLPDDYVATLMGNRWLLGAGAGVQFPLSHPFFHADRLGLAYDYYSRATVTGQINKFQTVPTYSYTYNLTSNVLWLDNQLDVGHLGQMIPFIDLAIGAAWHRTDNYQELPLPNVPPQNVRVNGADLASNNSTEFAWRVGIGGNVNLTDKVKMGLIYRYANLGRSSTGPSGFYPTVGGINNSVAGNEAVLSLRYDFDTADNMKK